MTEQDYLARLQELTAELGTLPPAEREKAKALLAVAQANHQRVGAAMKGIQENLDYLRLCIKYLMFDLEATRRENSYLRKMLEERGDEGSAGAD